MRGHPIRNRLGRLPAEIGIGPEENEETEIQQRHQPSEQVLPEREVDIAEPRRDDLRRDACTDRTEPEERQHEDRQRHLVAGAAVTDRLDLAAIEPGQDRKSTRLNSSHPSISYAVFCLKKKN